MLHVGKAPSPARKESIPLECSFPVVPIRDLLIHTSPSEAHLKRVLARELGCFL
jgi:hypothetical protein